MKKNDTLNKNIFLPICQSCGDILKVEINAYKMNIYYKCDNENISKTISYKDFHKYLIDANLLDEEFLKNENLPQFLYEEKIKHFKDIKNNFNKIELYKKHNIPISEYCRKSKTNICLFCNRDNVQKGDKDDRVYYGDIIPSNYNYDNLNNEIQKREKKL